MAPNGQIKEWQKAEQQAKEGSVPSHVRKDHLKDKNPYLSRYGREEWVRTIRKCSALSVYRCVTEII
jgi:hypothetical protein